MNMVSYGKYIVLVLANILQSLAGSYDMCSFLIEVFSSRVLVKKSTPKIDRIHEILVCDFSSKQVDRLRLHSIFRDTSVERLLPDKVRELTFFHFGKFLKTLSIDILKDILGTDHMFVFPFFIWSMWTRSFWAFEYN